MQLDNLKDLSSRSVSVLKYVALSGFQPPLQTPVDSSAARSSNDLFGSALVDLNSFRSDMTTCRLSESPWEPRTKQLEEGYIMVYTIPKSVSPWF